jgi:hypothetical protein
MGGFEIDKAKASFSPALAAAARQPSITTATRLETQPSAVGMQASLAAGVADPLWFLARQWQFNEFQGEDAGSPLKVAFGIEGTTVGYWRPRKDGADWRKFENGGPPLEALIEAEAAWKLHPRLRGEAGLQLLRIAPAGLRKALLKKYPLTLPRPADPEADRAGLQWSILLNGKTVDAFEVARDLRRFRNASGQLKTLPAGLKVPAADNGKAKTLLAQWLVWFEEFLFEGKAANEAWQANRMEYAFDLSTGRPRAGGTSFMLGASEYTDGHVDWEEFSLAPDPSAGSRRAQKRSFEVTTRHPTPVRYAGMPASRYWEFEDGAVNFAGAEAGLTDLLRMSVTEFALTFGNDWFIVPVRLPVGYLHRVAHFEVTDSFGITSKVGPVENLGTPWSMFELQPESEDQKSALAHTIFLPDALETVLEGAVLERTLLVRDEMANLAWAIEKSVQGVSGESIDRDMEAKGLAFHQQIEFEEPPEPQLVYRLMTPVPANWIPLLPTRKPGQLLSKPLELQLQCAAMKRFFPRATDADSEDYQRFLDTLDAEDTFIRSISKNKSDTRIYEFYPRGWLLRKDPTRKPASESLPILEEEEVPRIGATVMRSFQYARSADGRAWMWIGRRKTAGRGEARSNLRFDVPVRTSILR